MSPHRPGSAACLDVFARLSDYLDDELDADFCEHVAEHLEDCPPCESFLESLRRTVALIGTLDDPALEADLRRRIVEDYHALRQRIDES